MQKSTEIQSQCLHQLHCSLYPLITASKWLFNVWITQSKQMVRPSRFLFLCHFWKCSQITCELIFRGGEERTLSEVSRIKGHWWVLFTWRSVRCVPPRNILSGPRKVLPAPAPGRICRTLNLLHVQETKPERHTELFHWFQADLIESGQTVFSYQVLLVKSTLSKSILKKKWL